MTFVRFAKGLFFTLAGKRTIGAAHKTYGIVFEHGSF